MKKNYGNRKMDRDCGAEDVERRAIPHSEFHIPHSGEDVERRAIPHSEFHIPHSGEDVERRAIPHSEFRVPYSPERNLKQRTKAFALRIIQLVKSLPRGRISYVIGNQLLRSGTSVGANYRTAARARSRADFISQMGIVEQEADESLFWIELLVEAKLVKEEDVADLMKEADEIISMVVSSINTARKNR